MAFEELLSTRRIELPYSFASIGVHQGARFLYRADRVLSLTEVPRKVLAEGVFHFGHGKPEKATFHTFGGRHFEDLRLVRSERAEPAMRIDEIAPVMSWRRMPQDGANDHPIRVLHCWVDGIAHVDDRFVPPSWPHYYRRFTEEPIPHHDIAPIYGGRHITDWQRRDYEAPESFPATHPRPLSDYDVDPRTVDVREADAIASSLQQSADLFYAVVEGDMLYEIAEPRIRVRTSGKPGGTVYVEYSHYVMDHSQPAEEIVVHHRLDDIDGARATAQAFAATLGSKIVERGSLDRVDADSLHLDCLATTVEGIAPRLPDLIDRCAMLLPDEAIRHGQRLRSIWKGGEEPTAPYYHYVTGRDRGSSRTDDKQEAWMTTWRALQATIGRMRATEAPDAWFSRLIVANEAIRQASGFSPTADFVEPPAVDVPTSPVVHELLQVSARFATQGDPVMTDAWIALRRMDDAAGEDVSDAVAAFREAGERTFLGTELEARWTRNVVPLVEEVERAHAGRPRP